MNAEFLSDLVVVLSDDTANDGQGEWRLETPLVFRAAGGREFTVPTGFTTDFASVPRLPLAYLFAGNRAHRAAVLHDWLIRYEVVPRREADNLFREAMRATKIPDGIADIMHLAVRSYTDSLDADVA
jgi:hypothetical protein